MHVHKYDWHPPKFILIRKNEKNLGIYKQTEELKLLQNWSEVWKKGEYFLPIPGKIKVPFAVINCIHDWNSLLY